MAREKEEGANFPLGHQTKFVPASVGEYHFRTIFGVETRRGWRGWGYSIVWLDLASG